MEELSGDGYSNEADTWSKLLGSFSRKHDLPIEAQLNQGLIVLTTGNGTEVCPLFQIDKDESGGVRLNPHIARAWGLLSSLHVSQLDESPWTAAVRLAQPRAELNDLSWADALKDSAVSEYEKLRILNNIVADAVEAAANMGYVLVDPNKVIP